MLPTLLGVQLSIPLPTKLIPRYLFRGAPPNNSHSHQCLFYTILARTCQIQLMELLPRSPLHNISDGIMATNVTAVFADGCSTRTLPEVFNDCDNKFEDLTLLN